MSARCRHYATIRDAAQDTLRHYAAMRVRCGATSDYHARAHVTQLRCTTAVTRDDAEARCEERSMRYERDGTRDTLMPMILMRYAARVYERISGSKIEFCCIWS